MPNKYQLAKARRIAARIVKGCRDEAKREAISEIRKQLDVAIDEAEGRSK